MRFKWIKKSSEQAVICMAVARIICKGSSIEEAVSNTLQTGQYSKNPTAISHTQLQRIYKAVNHALKKTTKKIS